MNLDMINLFVRIHMPFKISQGFGSIDCVGGIAADGTFRVSYATACIFGRAV